jgi:hypothetical protein
MGRRTRLARPLAGHGAGWAACVRRPSAGRSGVRELGLGRAGARGAAGPRAAAGLRGVGWPGKLGQAGRGEGWDTAWDIWAGGWKSALLGHRERGGGGMARPRLG